MSAVPNVEIDVTYTAANPPPPSINHWQGWQDHLLHPPVRPEKKEDFAFRRLDAADRYVYDEDRRFWHENLASITTPQWHAARDAMEKFRLREEKNHRAGAGMAIGLTGASNVGKSSILTAYLAKFELQLRKDPAFAALDAEHPPRLANGALELPVVYTTATSSVGGTLIRLVQFFEEPANGDKDEKPTYGANNTARKLILDRHLRASQVRIIGLDQGQQFENGNADSAEMSELLKHLLDEHRGKILIVAGIGLEDMAIFNDGSRTRRKVEGQTGHRFLLHHVEPYPVSDLTQLTELLGFLESQVILHGAKDGDLTRHADYIARRTNGVMGNVMKLIRGAAATAINTGTEQITRKIMQDTPISHAEPRRLR